MKPSVPRLATLFAAALTSLVCRAAAGQPAKPARCATAEHHRLDYWLGDWDAYDLEDSEKLIARTHVDAIVGGCTLLETYEQNDGLLGQSFTLWDAARKVWHHTWVNNGGGLMVLEGQFQDTVLTLQGTLTSLDGHEKIVRDVWSVRPDGSVREAAQVSVDGGKTWKPYFDVLFRRHKAGAAAPR